MSCMIFFMIFGSAGKLFVLWSRSCKQRIIKIIIFLKINPPLPLPFSFDSLNAGWLCAGDDIMRPAGTVDPQKSLSRLRPPQFANHCANPFFYYSQRRREKQKSVMLLNFPLAKKQCHATYPTPSLSSTENKAIPTPSPDIATISTNKRRFLK